MIVAFFLFFVMQTFILTKRWSWALSVGVFNLCYLLFIFFSIVGQEIPIQL